MKKLIKLLAPIALTAGVAVGITYFIVSKVDSARLTRTETQYEAELMKLETKLEDLQGKYDALLAKAPTAPAAAEAAKVQATPAAQTSVPAVPAPAAASGAKVRYDAATSGSKCRIEGTSTIHDWKMETSIIGGFFEVDPKVKFDRAQASLAGVGEDGRVTAAGEASIPVRSLKSYSTKMDQIYQDHMEAIKYRKIEYRLKGLTLKKTAHAPNTPFEFDSTGDLIIHGVTNSVSMAVKIDPIDAKQLKITGTTPLKMTAYKVQPPCPVIAGMPTITTGDDITVTFEWVVARPDTLASN